MYGGKKSEAQNQREWEEEKTTEPEKTEWHDIWRIRETE